MAAFEIEMTADFRRAYADGVFGALVVRGVPNRTQSARIDDEMRRLEQALRARFPCDAIDGHPVARAYTAHFKRFGGRYPVVHQAKAVLGGKPIAPPSALVAVMFAAELDNLVLTSGHDLDALAGPLRIDAAAPGDAYTKISGNPQRLQAGDMIARDRDGIIASVLHGPDHRTRLRAESRAALFAAWCPAGVRAEVVEGHLVDVARLIRLEWPSADVEALRILRASGADHSSSLP